MIKGRELMGLSVTTVDGRRQIGEIKDIIYDPETNIVLGYILDNKKWLKDGKGFLQTDVVKREDGTIFIQDESVVKKLHSIPELKAALEKRQDLRGLKVETQEGSYLGTIQDLVLDGESGKISGYEVSDGVIEDLLKGRMTISNQGITINEDKVIAPVVAANESFYEGDMKNELSGLRQ